MRWLRILVKPYPILQYVAKLAKFSLNSGILIFHPIMRNESWIQMYYLKYPL